MYRCPECGSSDVTAHVRGRTSRVTCYDCAYWWYEDEEDAVVRDPGECPKCKSQKVTYKDEGGAWTQRFRCVDCGYRDPEEDAE